MTIKQVLSGKSINTIYSAQSTQTVFDALQLMAEKNIGAVLVIDEGQLTGIFSERDYARKVILQGRASKDTLVADVMTSKLVTIGPDDKLETAMFMMSDRHIRHLPVIDKESLIGIISINDVVSAIIRDQREHIHSLESYISGNPF